MTPETITALQALVQADPVLLEQLHNATNLDSAAQLLAQAANQKGVVVDRAAIATYMQAHRGAPLSDQDLEPLAGGGGVTSTMGTLWPKYRNVSKRTLGG